MRKATILIVVGCNVHINMHLILFSQHGSAYLMRCVLCGRAFEDVRICMQKWCSYTCTHRKHTLVCAYWITPRPLFGNAGTLLPSSAPLPPPDFDFSFTCAAIMDYIIIYYQYSFQNGLRFELLLKKTTI